MACAASAHRPTAGPPPARARSESQPRDRAVPASDGVGHRVRRVTAPVNPELHRGGGARHGGAATGTCAPFAPLDSDDWSPGRAIA
jgi:hypothetical protein